eukprot:CAMPEP_0184481084 /NCGR_PEP_ID=MMETSP0113_2-20130426/2623_1 /TAXON_ID=91329 /ORGANISM="Norrisiella sphaerica, Strain BC52" /LENGTH=150 /DNA_ID=CAMNT_0026859991 /DNA_START=394 /DNA_END=846 /DNA_ORIENTATION=+
MRDKETGATTSSSGGASKPVTEPKIGSTTQQRPAPSMGIEYQPNTEDSPPRLNPFTAQASSTSSFKALYAIAQMPSVKKHIKYILSRKDITDAQRVESIATLLRGSSSKSSVSGSLSSSLAPNLQGAEPSESKEEEYDDEDDVEMGDVEN